jgi:hypothetical protein
MSGVIHQKGYRTIRQSDYVPYRRVDDVVPI